MVCLSGSAERFQFGTKDGNFAPALHSSDSVAVRKFPSFAGN
jgi:hypothetical protein